MRILTCLMLLMPLIITHAIGQGQAPSTADRDSLLKTTEQIRAAFGRGDVAAIVALHHPGVMKWFGGDNIVRDRADLAKGLRATFETSRLEFVRNQTESLVFTGETAIETSLFIIKAIPKNGSKPSLSQGRAMVVYVHYKNSPTGWASLREVVQWAAPPK